MRGTAYAIAEIVVFLAIATFVGVAIGWVLSRMRAPSAVRTVPAATTAPRRSGDDGRAKQLEERIQQLEAEKQRLAAAAEAPAPAPAPAAAAPEIEELRKELAQAQWQIRTLEDALAGAEPSE